MSVIKPQFSPGSRLGHDTDMWPSAVRWIHWLTALVVLVAIAAVLGHESVEEKSLRKLILSVHKQAGVLVLLLTGLRVLVRISTKRPVDSQTGLARLAAAGAHGLIYLILFTLPALGWSLANARGDVVQLFGFTLPTLLARDRDLADTLEQIHATLGWVLIGLVALHVLAGLWHHRIKKDGVLVSMLGVKG